LEENQIVGANRRHCDRSPHTDHPLGQTDHIPIAISRSHSSGDLAWRRQDRKGKKTSKLKEGIVSTQAQSSQGVSDHLHPRIYMAAAGLLIWFVIAAWLLFDDAGYIELALAMISVLVFLTIAIPLALRRTNLTVQRSNDSMRATEQKSETLDAWLRGRFVTWTGEEKGLTAAIEILLPLAAVAFGITALGIVLGLTRAGAV
jgi:hypothetical protein